MTTLFEMPIAMKNYQSSYRKRIIVVGCGGTGGYLVPNLARLVASWNNDNIELILLDGDRVEAKNLTRQNFITPDLGRYKAEVLAERYSAAFGIQIQYIPEYLKSTKVLTRMTLDGNGSTIVIGCVDNHRTRREIGKWFRRRQGRVWIDAGNEEMHGQVICGINFDAYDPNNTEADQPFGLPSVADLFPEVDRDRKAVFNDELSCAERAESAPQNIATNIMAANYLLNFTQQVLMGEPLYTHGVFFSTDRSSTDSMLNLSTRLDADQWPGYKRPKKRNRRAA